MDVRDLARTDDDESGALAYRIRSASRLGGGPGQPSDRVDAADRLLVMTQAMSVVALLVALPAAVSGLRTPVTARARVSTVAKTRPVDLSRYPLPRIDDPARAAPARFDAGAALAAAVLALELSPAAAFAKDGAYGLLEKKAPALVHPAIMLIVFVVALNAAFTGFQWRQLRELGTEVNALKAELKPLSEKAEASESVPAALASQISELEAKIKDASALRSDLQSKNLRDTHWQTGSVLLGIGTAIAIEGPVNTFMRAGKVRCDHPQLAIRPTPALPPPRRGRRAVPPVCATLLTR